MTEHILYSQRVMTPQGLKPASIHIINGKISNLTLNKQVENSEDFGQLVIMPGLVDTHVHVNEPGRTEWEGFITATKASAAGGITTLIDMPLNCIPVTTTLEAYQTKLKAIQNHCWINCGFWGGVIPGNTSELEPMIEAGIMGFKAFLIDSGIDDFPFASEADLRQAMPILAKHNIPLLAHAELEGELPSKLGVGDQNYQEFLNSRPKSWEDNAIQLMINLCREFGTRVHIVHLSSSSALDMIQAAKKEGLPFSVETCPHYLFFDAESIANGRTDFKCMPPIREKENQELLWQGLREGIIDFIVSDHSPCTPGLKLMEEGNFEKAWGGIASLQFGLSSIWTRAKSRGHTIEDLYRWMSLNTSNFVGLENTKGQLAPGFDADLVIWNPEEEFTLTPDMIHHRHKVSPYNHQLLSGVVKQTILNGQTIYKQGAFSDSPTGQMIYRK